MPKKETKILLISFLLIDIISISIFIFLFSFTKNLIADSVNKEDEIKIELKKEDAKVLMKNDFILGKMYKEKLINYMIPSGGVIDFIKILEQLVLKSEIKSDIKMLGNGIYDKGNSIGAEFVKINMNVIGEWKNIQFFLMSLENYPLKIDINKISLNKISTSVKKGKTITEWSGNFEFTIVKIK
ncbi:MAG: hypothetical protein V1910_01315 [bacterium]